MSENLKVSWIDRGYEAKCQPDPRFPAGVDLDVTKGEISTCETSLPYPAKRCGYFLIHCDLCRLSCLVTTAGRADDPRSVKVACKKQLGSAA